MIACRRRELVELLLTSLRRSRQKAGQRDGQRVIWGFNDKTIKVFLSIPEPDF